MIAQTTLIQRVVDIESNDVKDSQRNKSNHTDACPNNFVTIGSSHRVTLVKHSRFNVEMHACEILFKKHLKYTITAFFRFLQIQTFKRFSSFAVFIPVNQSSKHHRAVSRLLQARLLIPTYLRAYRDWIVFIRVIIVIG